MPVSIPPRFSKLSEWLKARFEAESCTITAFVRLSGGAIQENWLLDASFVGGERPGSHEWVLRTDAATSISTSHGRPQEFAILRAAHRAGVAAPEPIALCEDSSIIGTPFFIMARATGTAQGRKITRDPRLADFGPDLAHELGRQLARLHKVTPPSADLGFLPIPNRHPAQARIDRYRSDLDALPGSHPVLEFALNWLESNKPQANSLSLCHTDFRTGNYLTREGKLTAVLDWEFASWSDPDEDIGWFVARCWRFGNDNLKAGGIAPMEAFLGGYEQESGRTVSRITIPYWQVMAELRWAVIALQQGERCSSGTEVTQELALSGIMPPEMELNMLNLIDSMGAPT